MFCPNKIIIKPDNAQAWTNLGILLTGLQRFSEAEEAYRKALLCAPLDWVYRKDIEVVLKNLEKKR